MNPEIRKFDPAVDKRLLIALSGIIWSIVGIILCSLAVGWLSKVTVENGIWFGPAGIILSLMIHHFGFLRLVDKNIARIIAKKGKVCIFGFQPWKSYLIIVIMVGMGIFLRHSSLPKPYLSIIYIGFGGAMLLSSLRYYRIFFKLISNPGNKS
ncbi:MAG TPA: hypothetical protein ENH24_05305 [Nitrospirae bacterium]|nr:hypothetical protein [Nitrospirota bacterium]